MIAALLDAIAADPARRWRESDVVALGYDLGSVRRSFKRQFGVTFLEMARMERLRLAAGALAGGVSVMEAQLEAGFDGPSAFRAAFARHLGVRPSDLAREGQLRADWIDTPLGAMVAVADKRGLYLLEFADRPALARELRALWADCKGNLGFGRYPATDQIEAELTRYFSGQSARFDVQTIGGGSPFSQAVWRALQAIPAGETRSYSALAETIGRPDAVRAVARANGANRLAIVVPCHRVLGMDGSLTGYGGGLWRKQKLIEIEAQFVQEKRNEQS